MVQCCAGSACRFPAVAIRPDLWKCFHCNRSVHYPCAVAYLSARGGPDNLVCPSCSEHTASLGDADPVVTLVDPEFPTDQLKTVTLCGKKYPVPFIDGPSFCPPISNQQAADVPHPNRKDAVVSPFKTKFKKSSYWWILYSCANTSLAANKGILKGCGNYCNICGRDVNISAQMSTGPLKSHIQRAHPEVFETCMRIWKVAPEKDTQSIISAGSLTKKISKEDAKAIMVAACSRLVVAKTLPFDTIAHPEFRRVIRKAAMLGAACPIEIGKDAITTEIANMKLVCLEALKLKLRGQALHMTLDHWTDQANRSFEGISAQFISDDCKVHRFDLECTEFTGSTAGDRMCSKFAEKATKTWNATIRPDTHVYIQSKDSPPTVGPTVTDTEPKMNTFGMALEIISLPGHVYCGCHNLQLTAIIAFSHKFLKDEEEIAATNKKGEANVLKKLRSLCNLFNSTQKHHALLKTQTEMKDQYGDATPVGMVNDVETRWWSTSNMVDRALYLRPALQRMDLENLLRASDDRAGSPSRCPTKSEWELLQQLSLLLKPFKEAQQVLEGNAYVTSSLVHFCVDVLTNELENYVISDEDKNLSEGLKDSILDCAILMKKDLEERWGSPTEPWQGPRVVRVERNRQFGFHPTFILATALDPRFKDMSPINDEHVKCIKAHLVKEMVVARKQQIKLNQEITEAELAAKAKAVPSPAGKVSSDANAVTPDNQPARKKQRKAVMPNQEGGIFARYANQYRHQAQEQPVAAAVESDAEITLFCKQELERFYQSAGLAVMKEGSDSELEDPLAWWFVKKSSFPTVWLLARYYLGVPATSANSERAFSYAGQLLDSSRTRMTAKLAEDTFFVNRNFAFLPHSPEKPKRKQMN